MAALRSQLADTLLQSASLDFAVGGGVMYYNRKRPALPTDLNALSPTGEGLLPSEVAGGEMAQVLVALIFIARGALDAAHDIVGSLDSPEATYAHAMIHRQEGASTGEAGLPGYSNSRYWFSCLGEHPLFAQMTEFVAAHPGVPRTMSSSEWDPAAFVQHCARSEQSGSPEDLAFCTAVQRKEWELLFDWCAESAGAA